MRLETAPFDGLPTFVQVNIRPDYRRTVTLGEQNNFLSECAINGTNLWKSCGIIGWERLRMPRQARFARLLSFLLALGVAAHAATTTIWAGGFGGLYKSIDSGTTWQPVTVSVSNPLLQGTADPQTPNVTALALDPQQPATVYFVGEMPGTGVTGFFRSTDNGNTWTATVLNNGIVPNIFPSPYILVDPVRTNVIYQVWLNGLAKSTDYGATWSMANRPMGGTVTGLSVDPNASGVLYWSSGPYLFKSVDFATTWTPLAPVATTESGLLLGNVVVDLQNSNNLYVGDTEVGFCGTPAKFCGLFRSADGGQSWTNVAVGAEFQQMAFDSRTGIPYVWAAETGVGYRVFTSTNGGNTWNPASNQPPYSVDFPIHLFSDPAAVSSLFGYAWGENLWFKSTDAAETFTTIALPPATNLDSAAPNPQLMVAAVPQALGNVSAATFESGPVAPESLVSALGFDLGTGTFPTAPQSGATSIGGTTITVVDSKGTSRLAPLLYVSPGQVYYEIPAGTALGVATIAVESGDGVVTRAPLGIAPVAPTCLH